jgi:hypothetical protein
VHFAVKSAWLRPLPGLLERLKTMAARLVAGAAPVSGPRDATEFRMVYLCLEKIESEVFSDPRNNSAIGAA